MDPTALTIHQRSAFPDGRLFQQLVGTLNYLSDCTRAELALSVSLLSRRTKNLTANGLKLAKRCLAYVYHNSNQYLQYHKLKSPSNLKVYVESSWGKDPEIRRSIFGFVLFIHGNILIYKINLEPLVTTSCTEAGFVAISLTIKKVCTIRSVLEVFYIPLETTVIYCDK